MLRIHPVHYYNQSGSLSLETHRQEHKNKLKSVGSIQVVEMHDQMEWGLLIGEW